MQKKEEKANKKKATKREKKKGRKEARILGQWRNGWCEQETAKGKLVNTLKHSQGSEQERGTSQKNIEMCSAQWLSVAPRHRCALVKYQGTFSNFFGIEHSLREEEMDEQFQRKLNTAGAPQQTRQESPMSARCKRWDLSSSATLPWIFEG